MDATLEAVLTEVETRVRIAEAQGWTNRSVPVRLLRQIAEELRKVGSAPVSAQGLATGPMSPAQEKNSSLCSSCPALEAEITKLKAAMQIMDANVTHFATRANQAEAQLAALRTNGDAEIARPTSASEAHARGLPVLGAAGALEQPRPTSRVCFYCKGTVTPANDPFHVHGCNECLCGLEPPHNRDLHEDQAELIAALEQQIGEVYALARGPIEQARAIPLGQWVKTRFVHIEDFNEQIISREDREKALGAAVAVNVAHVRENHESEKYLTEARRLLQLGGRAMRKKQELLGAQSATAVDAAGQAVQTPQLPHDGRE